MRRFRWSIVALLLLLTGVILVRGLIPVASNADELSSFRRLGVFLNSIVNDHSQGSTGGVCFLGVPTTPWRMVQDILLRRVVKFGNWIPKRVIMMRFCDTPRLCVSAERASETRQCALLVLLVQRGLLQHLQELSRVPFWTSSAVHVFISEGSNGSARKANDRVIENLLAFGILRSLFVKFGPSMDFHLPVLFQGRMIEIADADTARRWLRDFDQLANLHGYQYRTLYHTLIPYLYRYDGAFGGPDYRFLSTVLERQNATHQWIYHRRSDVKLNSTDLQHVDRRLLEQGRASFSLNRLLDVGRSETLEQMYLNTFDGTCVMIPRRQFHTFILKLWQPFSQYLWYTVLAIALLTAVGNLTLPTLFAVNYLLALLFGSSILDYRMAAVDRTILLALDVLLFLLREAYTAKIITYMIEVQYEPPLQTIAELGRVGPPLLLAPADYGAFVEKLVGVESPPRVVLREDFSSFNTSWQEYFRPDFAHPVPCSYGQALVGSVEMNSPGAPQFYLLGERLAISPEAFTFPRNSLFRARIGWFATSLLETGIYGSWFRGDYYARDHTPTLDEILRFENLASLFYVLLVGYAASLVVFGVEQLVASINRKRSRLWAKKGRKEKRNKTKKSFGQRKRK